MDLRRFALQVERDIVKFEREIRTRHARGEIGERETLDLDYDDWFELFIEHTMPGYIEPPDVL